MPECAYRPGGPWKHPITGASEEARPGNEEFLAEQGLQWTVLDAHLLRAGDPAFPYGCDLPPEEVDEPGGPHPKPFWIRRSSVAAFLRDARTAAQVWSRQGGYPGDGAFLDFHKRHWPSGLRLWRVTGSEADLVDKLVYWPEDAAARAREQAEHFVELAAGLEGMGGGVVCAPFDAELFGHWWFEGPIWLERVLELASPGATVEATTPARELDSGPSLRRAFFAEGSWGAGGDHRVWVNDDTAWFWRELAEAERRAFAAVRWGGARKWRRAILNQLLLAAASDWPFLVTMGTGRDYAEKRFRDHARSAAASSSISGRARAGSRTGSTAICRSPTSSRSGRARPRTMRDSGAVTERVLAQHSATPHRGHRAAARGAAVSTTSPTTSGGPGIAARARAVRRHRQPSLVALPQSGAAADQRRPPALAGEARGRVVPVALPPRDLRFRPLSGGGDRELVRRAYPGVEGPIAYFCMEYGLHQSLPLYSGGLGVLAGDHLKSASDLGLPLVGVGLLYRNGYFRQTHRRRRPPAAHLSRHTTSRACRCAPPPATPAAASSSPCRCRTARSRPRSGSRRSAACRSLLLDTDVPQNDSADRPITSMLYTPGREMRLAQELVLGVGGARALAALGIEPRVWHMNEGHSALLQFERLRAPSRSGADLDSAVAGLRRTSVFTTHTPVPAGNEVFEAALARKYFGPWSAGTGARPRALARARPQRPRPTRTSRST